MTHPHAMKNFSRAALSYDTHAEFQNHAALELAGFIERESRGSQKPEKILELGCGTGFLTTHLMKFFPESEITASDVSCAMLKQTRLKFTGNSRVKIIPYDFNEAFSCEDGFDMLVSGMALQWAYSLESTFNHIKQSLRPGAKLFFSIPLDGTFRRLREVFKEEGAEFPGLDLYNENEIKKILAKSFGEDYISEHKTWSGEFGSVKEFFLSLRNTGTDNASGSAVPAPVLRRILKKYSGKVSANYEYAFFKCSIY